MAIRKIKPTTPGQRGMTVSAYDEITCTTPERSLLEDLKSSGGRNNHGRITVRHRGGGAKRKYRIIDFKRNKDGVPAKVATIEYDPNRSANIAQSDERDLKARVLWRRLRQQPGKCTLKSQIQNTGSMLLDKFGQRFRCLFRQRSFTGTKATNTFFFRQFFQAMNGEVSAVFHRVSPNQKYKGRKGTGNNLCF